MKLIIIFFSMIVGIFLSLIITTYSSCISKGIQFRNIFINNFINYSISSINIFIILFSTIAINVSFFKYYLSYLFLKAVLFDCILIFVSFIDYEHRIIPNKIVLLSLIIGFIFSFFPKYYFYDSLEGMLFGGGILFLLALIPNVLGGGDIKLMLALGLFLGLKRVVIAILLAFVLASCISLLLIIFKIKTIKDYIPFAPFLALGSFIAFHLL